jgi:dTDP-4-dehydrorhamnose 3,5-epimerase-like enzyme
MTKLNCKPGDLAVVVTAHNPDNIGTILRVIRAHRDQNALVDFKGQHIWLAEAPRAMTYTVGGKLVKRKRGAVPDVILRPIRGSPGADEKCTTETTEDKVAA